MEFHETGDTDMTSPNDWRLRNQEHYLKGKTFVHRAWRPRAPEWEHDHCEFCGEKFSDADGDLHEGYATEDNYHWICPVCFRDFEVMFDWVVRDHMD